MKFQSTNNQSTADLKQAVTHSLAPDGGLYIPAEIPKLPKEFFENIAKLSFAQIAFTVAKNLLQDAIDDPTLLRICEETVNFPCPLVQINENTYVLELFHGPTLAFKDFGARFMSRLVQHFATDKITVLVATSGDTGSAVAHGFLGIPNTEVILLYPKGKVSPLQEKQLTTMGQNITALEVDGTFDDCQSMVKQAFADQELNEKYNLTSANSINIARLIPQTFYYFFAYQQLSKPAIYSVPSGNFGNITAGLLANAMGLPVSQFIAAVNANDTFPRFQQSGQYEPKPSVQTISNAMDIGNPSNFARLQALHLTDKIWSKSFSDEETIVAMQEWANQYILDPHGAVGYLGLKTFRQEHPEHQSTPGIILETAHPAKFREVVQSALGQEIEIPEALAKYASREKQAILIENNYNALKKFLKNR